MVLVNIYFLSTLGTTGFAENSEMNNKLDSKALGSLCKVGNLGNEEHSFGYSFNPEMLGNYETMMDLGA